MNLEFVINLINFNKRHGGEKMSWGERSCKHLSNFNARPCIPNFGTCNVNCKTYEWNGKTKPDSQKKDAFPPEYEMSCFGDDGLRISFIDQDAKNKAKKRN